MFSLSGDHSFAHHMSDITAGKYVISRAEKRQKYSPGLCSDCPVDITTCAPILEIGVWAGQFTSPSGLLGTVHLTYGYFTTLNFSELKMGLWKLVRKNYIIPNPRSN